MTAIPTLGRRFIGAALFAAGVRQILTLGLVRLVPPLPAWVPWPSFWAVFVGGLLLLVGTAILVERRMRPALAIAGALLLALLLFHALPYALDDPLTGFKWTKPFKLLALLGGLMLLWAPTARRDILLSAPRYFLAAFLFVSGLQHFTYAGFVDTLVPKWIPPGPRPWTYFAGVALLAGGAGVSLPATTRLAARMSALMVFLWVLMLHIPRAITMKSWPEFDAASEALAISGVALLLAAARNPPPTEPDAQRRKASGSGAAHS